VYFWYFIWYQCYQCYSVVEAFKRHSLKILRPQTTLNYTGTRPVWCGDTEIHALFPALVFPEASRAFGITPETGYWVKKQEEFSTASVRLTFRTESMKDTPKVVVLMGARLRVEYPTERGIRPPQCKRCWELHRTEGCKGEPKCRLCGDAGHQTAAHPPQSSCKCVNCEGEHAADSPICPKTAPISPRKAPKTQQGKTQQANNKC
jgi:hypothetical protein